MTFEYFSGFIESAEAYGDKGNMEVVGIQANIGHLVEWT
jgi:hypothetical protein